MMRLTTYSQKQSDERSVFVLWRVGITNFGVLTVEFTHPIEDIELAAELVAIRHLVFNQAVFDRIPDSGKAFELNVSKGAIKKLSLNRSDKKHLLKFAAFMQEGGRFAGAKINIKSESPINHDDGAKLTKITINPKEYRIQEIVQTPRIGELVITEHAVDRYVQYHSAADMKNPWASLINRMQHEDLHKIPLDPRVIEHKRRKYGPDNEVEIWGHDSSVHRYVVITDAKTGMKILATLFKRASNV